RDAHPVTPGASRANLTREGCDWPAPVPETCLLVGDGILQVTRYTSPCVNITASFERGDYGRISQKRHPGWSRVYARVLRSGTIRPGDPVRLVSAGEAERR